jgi:predicted LPLAT superfamily acyltransferase
VSAKWWHIPESGSALGVRILAVACRLFGRQVARFLLLFVATYYVALKPSVRSLSRAYLTRVGRPTTLSAVYRHVLRFAQCSLDRFFFLSGDVSGFKIGIHGFELLLQQRATGKGALLVGGHLGSFDALRALAKSKDGVEVYAGVYFDNARRVTQEL